MQYLRHIIGIEWKAMYRSPLWHRKLVVNLFLALSFLYLIANLVFFGALLDDVLIQLTVEGIDYNTHGRSFVLRRLNRYLLYYFMADFILRYFMQKLPALAVQPYLHLPVKRASLVHFMLTKSIWSPFNLWHFVFLTPFILEVFSNMPITAALSWSVGIVGLIMASNFALLYIKRSSESDVRVYFGMLAVFAGLIALHYFEWLDFNAVSGKLFNALFLYPGLGLVPLAMWLLFYWINFNYLHKNLYLGRIARSNRAEVSYVGKGFLSRFGRVGRLTDLEFKFILRNKRPRMVLLMTLLFLAYGLLIFTQPEFNELYLVYILFSVIITGMFILNYGQYLLGWDGSHFDHILTRNVSYYEYYMSKFLLFAIVGGTSMLLSIPYAWFGLEILLVIFCVFLFNLGISTHFVMFFGSLNPKKIDLSQGSMLNWQGVGAAQFLLVIPTLGLPLALYGLGLLFWGEMGAVLFIGVLGLLGLAGTRFWIKLLSRWLVHQRYSISNDFRNQ